MWDGARHVTASIVNARGRVEHTEQCWKSWQLPPGYAWLFAGKPRRTAGHPLDHLLQTDWSWTAWMPETSDQPATATSQPEKLEAFSHAVMAALPGVQHWQVQGHCGRKIYIPHAGRIPPKTPQHRVELQAVKLDMKYSTKGGKHRYCAEGRLSFVDKAFPVGRLGREDDV